MKNLAGDVDCDIDIINELKDAGVPIETRKSDGEVPYHVVGLLAGVTFTRAWYYWVVGNINMPLKDACELYDNPIGRKDIRVVGYAGNTPPEAWARIRPSLHRTRRIS